MSDINAALTTALGAISNAKGESLVYRTTHAGSTTALTGWVLHRDRPQQVLYLADRGAEAEVKEGSLKGPLSPAMSIGYEVVDGNSEAWVIESVMVDQQQICRVKRSRTVALAPDRGQTR